MNIFNGNCTKKKYLSNNYDKQIGNYRISHTRIHLLIYLLNIPLLMIIRRYDQSGYFLKKYIAAKECANF